jgi:hypothetical protein
LWGAREKPASGFCERISFGFDVIAHPYWRENTNASLSLSPAGTVPHPRLSDAPAIVNETFEVDGVESSDLSQLDRWQDWAPSAVGMFNDPCPAHAELLADIRDCEEFNQTVHTLAL